MQFPSDRRVESSMVGNMSPISRAFDSVSVGVPGSSDICPISIQCTVYLNESTMQPGKDILKIPSHFSFHAVPVRKYYSFV